MSTQNPPAGWYEDPRGEADLRWWDGAAWTAHTSARPSATPAPMAPPVARAAEPATTDPFGQSAAAASGGGAAKPVPIPASGPGSQPSIEIAGVRHDLAAWWPRAVGFVIDAMIRFAFTLPFLVVAVLIAIGIDWQAIDLEKLQGGQAVDGRIPGLTASDTARLGGAFLVLIAGSLLVELTYQPLTMARKGENNGRTWGMQAMGIRVVRDNGRPMTYGPALVREFLVMGVLFGIIGAIGNAVAVVAGTVIVLVFYLWPLWDAQNRAAQDFICSTHVVAD